MTSEPAGAGLGPGGVPGSRPRPRHAWRRSHQVLVAPPVVVLLRVAASFAPLLAPADPTALNPRAKAQAPTLAHPLGTDEFGRDLLSRLLHGAPLTLFVGRCRGAASAR